MIASGNFEEYLGDLKVQFLKLTGLSNVEVRTESAGPEVFLRFLVGRDASLYREALARMDQDLPAEHPFHGRLSLLVEPGGRVLPASAEVELLRQLITRSLRVTSDALEKGPVVQFVPFRGGEESRVVQPTNHAVLGRRGVGKSSLILLAFGRLLSEGNIPVWLDMQAYHQRSEWDVITDVLREILRGGIATAQLHYPAAKLDALNKGLADLEGVDGKILSPEEIRKLVPGLKQSIRAFCKENQKQLFVFLDDAHLLRDSLQPQILDIVHSVLKGVGGWLKVAGVKNILRLYDPATKVGLQPPHDVQMIQLDLTLVDPSAAKEHLTRVLQEFLSLCGIQKSGGIINSHAIDRLVWCSAGVPRDFLWLFDRSLAFAIQHRRSRVGVQEVNLAVGEFGQEKLTDLEQDTSEEAPQLREALDRLQKAALDDQKSNSFLIRQDSKHGGYKAVQKLVDLRLIHLIHPSITPGKAGDRYEAYLLDYSFYTGLRRRHGIKELAIDPKEPPKYAVLRKLPKIELDAIWPGEE
jgi:hypothetical protein